MAFSAAFTYSVAAMDLEQESQRSTCFTDDKAGAAAYEDLCEAFWTNRESNAQAVHNVLTYQMEQLALTQAGSNLFVTAAFQCGFSPLFEEFMMSVNMKITSADKSNAVVYTPSYEVLRTAYESASKRNDLGGMAELLKYDPTLGTQE